MFNSASSGFSDNIDISITYKNFSFTIEEVTVTLNGDIRLKTTINGNVTTVETRITELSFVNTYYSRLLQNVVGVSTDSSTNSTINISGSLTDTELAGKITFSTPTIFTFNSFDEPTAGVLLVKGANNSSIKVSVDSTTIAKIEIDSDGDQTYETTKYVPWSTLDF